MLPFLPNGEYDAIVEQVVYNNDSFVTWTFKLILRDPRLSDLNPNVLLEYVSKLTRDGINDTLTIFEKIFHQEIKPTQMKEHEFVQNKMNESKYKNIRLKIQNQVLANGLDSPGIVFKKPGLLRRFTISES